jgi:hypothetical protein
MKTKEYRGFVGEYHLEHNDGHYYGKIKKTKITFEGINAQMAQKDFINKVDTYIETWQIRIQN